MKRYSYIILCLLMLFSCQFKQEDDRRGIVPKPRHMEYGTDHFRFSAKTKIVIPEKDEETERIA